MADVLVLVDDGVALAALDGHRRDLGIEAPGLLRRLGPVLRGDGEAVLVLAGDLPARGDVLGRLAHVIAVEGVPQAVLDHGVDEGEVAHLLAVAQVRRVRRLAHALLAAGDDDPGVAFEDLLGAQRHRPQARAAELVQAPGRALDRHAGGDGRLARRPLARPRLQHLAQDHLLDLGGVHAGLRRARP